MGKLTTKERKKLPGSVFGLRKERKFPMPDRAHAINAKMRATEGVHRGTLSAAEKKRIFAAANRVLKHKHRK